MAARTVGRPEVTMFRITRMAALSTLALGASLSGCAENESSLFVQGVLAIAATDCLARPDPSAEFLSQGILDREFAPGYVAAVQVGNQITEQGNREKIRTETSRMHLEGVTGTVFDVNGGEHSFDAIATGFVHPAAGTSPGLSAMSVQLVNPDVLGALGGDGQIVVRFRVFGTTLGGQEIESGDYDFPIFLCSGCLVEYPLDALAPGVMPGEDYRCGTAPASTEGTRTCIRGQDQPFPCSECAAASPVCEFPSRNPWYQ